MSISVRGEAISNIKGPRLLELNQVLQLQLTGKAIFPYVIFYSINGINSS